MTNENSKKRLYNYFYAVNNGQSITKSFLKTNISRLISKTIKLLLLIVIIYYSFLQINQLLGQNNSESDMIIIYYAAGLISFGMLLGEISLIITTIISNYKGTQILKEIINFDKIEKYLNKKNRGK